MKARAQINAEQVVRVGQNALYFEDYMLSIQYFNQAIRAKPYLARPYFLRAIAKLNLEDYVGAEEDASLAIDRNPFIADAFEVRGVARQNLGKLRGAVEDYNEALALLPANRGIMFNKALAQQELEENDSAAVTFDALLRQYPNYENGYVGRARLQIERGDTASAHADLDKALSLNKNLPNAYLLRADMTLKLDTINPHWQEALTDLEEAIRLLPREAGLYVNRAFIRYNLDDYFGAMADYDYAIQLDATNAAAIYNRGLLRMEVRDNDKAIDDFSRVLQLNPDDYRALYNRALVYGDKNDLPNAIADVDRLIEALPDFPEALYMRSDLHRRAGRMAQAEKDYNKAISIAKNLKQTLKNKEFAQTSLTDDAGKASSGPSKPGKTDNEELSAESVARKFTALRTIDNTVNISEEYNNKSIRGRVQDRDRRIQIEPMLALSYYTSPNELKPSAYYLKEADDLNQTRLLRFVVMVTTDDLPLSNEDDINRHFKSIEYYNSFLSTHTPRAIDYFGRAMDFVMLRNYPAAIEDFNRAIALTPDFALAYYGRAIARYRSIVSEQPDQKHPSPSAAAMPNVHLAEFRGVISDFDKALEYSPRMAFAHYNKGNVLVAMQDYTSALSAYNKAIELKPDLGEAYYNRGYVYFQLGNRELGAENLSKAGELGVVPSYNLLKRMK